MTESFSDVFENLESSQVDLGGFTLELVVSPIGDQFLVELVLPPTRKATRRDYLVLATTHLPTREASEWIESVAGVVLAKLRSAERAAMLRRGYAV